MLTIFALTLGLQVVLTSCEGPEGPAGPQGPIGGDGSVVCGACHNLSTDLLQKIAQYEYSIHATGGTAIRSTTASCANCHSHEGFLEYMETGAVAAGIPVPLQPNCRTCHPIHESYTLADYAVSYTDPFELAITGSSYDIGTGNLCANCHQPRTLSPDITVGGPDVNITSYRWGYHHGPQGALYVGEGGYRIPGSMAYPASTGSKHMPLLDNSCVDCHMTAGYGTESGGHTWNMRNAAGAANVKACDGCHTGATNFDIMGGQTEIEHMLDSLKTLLTDAGIYGYQGSYIYAGTYTADEAGCYLNYQFLEEDRSLGVHNYSYAKALLTNSIEFLAKKKK